MQHWEYMFVTVFNGHVNKVDGKLYHQGQQDWETWLRARGLEGWELVSEVSFIARDVHATLKRPTDSGY
jgi:hypothetical protein